MCIQIFPHVNILNIITIQKTRLGCKLYIQVESLSVLASSVVDYGFEPRSGQTKDNKIGNCCFSAKHAALRRKSWLGNQDNVSQWGDMFISRLLFQWARYYKNPTKHVGLVQSGPQIHLIEINLFSPWYSWKIAELVLNITTHSLTIIWILQSNWTFMNAYNYVYVVINFCDSMWSFWVACNAIFAGFLLVRLYLYLSNYQEGEGWDPIHQFNPATWFCLS
jgi:hypothetical protein